MGSFQGGQVSAVRDLLALVWAPSICLVVDHNPLSLSHSQTLSPLSCCHAFPALTYSGKCQWRERTGLTSRENTWKSRDKEKSGRKMENYVTALTFGIFMLSKRHFFAWWLINSAGALLFKKRKKRKSAVFLKYFLCYVYSQQDLGRCFIKKNFCNYRYHCALFTCSVSYIFISSFCHCS